jgi:hypothetical protein
VLVACIHGCCEHGKRGIYVAGGENCHFHWVLNLFAWKRLKRFGDEFFVFLDFVWVLGGAIGIFRNFIHG